MRLKFKKLGNLRDQEEKRKTIQEVIKSLAILSDDFSLGITGNVSLKTKEGILISATSTELKSINYPGDFCEVVSSSTDKRLNFYGSKLPSSETRMHLLVYEKRPDISFCLHIHLSNIERLQIFDKFPITSKFLSYGTINLVEEASNLLESGNIVILRDHGIVIVGNSFEEMIKEVRRLNKI